MANSTHKAFEFPYVVSDNQLRTSALLNFILGAVSLLAFISVRGMLKGVGGVYQRRRELQDLFLQPPALLLGGLQQAWSWVTSVMCMSDVDIVRTAGFDALLLNRTILMGLQIFSVLTLLSVCILLPTYYSFDDIVTHRLHRGTNVAELSRTTISNLPPGHAILWLPALAMFLVTAYCCWVLLVHCQSYAELRMAYMLCLDAAGAQPYQERKPRRTPRMGPDSSSGGAGGSTGGILKAASLPERAGSGQLLPELFGSVGGAALRVPGVQGSGGGGGILQLRSTVGSSASLAGAPLLPPQPVPPLPPLCVHRYSGHTHSLPTYGSQGNLRSNLSVISLLGQGAQSSSGVAPNGTALTSTGSYEWLQHATGLARVSYDYAGVVDGSVVAGAHAGTPFALSVGGAVTPLAPHAPGWLGLRRRLRLVAPWLRHVVVSVAERAARHKAVDNLLAWVDPLRMLAKDREDWARQQLAADQDLDPSLPPVPSGQPPPATAAHGGLLVASEEMLMALTGRGDDATDPQALRLLSAGRSDWSDSVVALAESLGIWLRHRSGEADSGAAGMESALGGVADELGEERASEGTAVLALEEVMEGRASGTGRLGSVAAEPLSSTGRGSAAKVSAVGPLGMGPSKLSAGGRAADALPPPPPTGNSCSSGARVPAVYRYWAPEAEQRCFNRNLRRRQRRNAEALAAAMMDPSTPLGYDTVLNPVFERVAAMALVASAGGSTTDGGGMKGGPGRPPVARESGVYGLGGQGASADPSSSDGGLIVRSVGGRGVAASNGGGGWGALYGTFRQQGLTSLLDGTSRGGSESVTASGGGGAQPGGGVTGSARADVSNAGGGGRGPVTPGADPFPRGLWYDVPLGDSGGGGGIATATAALGGPERAEMASVVDPLDDDDAGSERPWTGWQQQPLVVGRCAARLRQLLKVRHGGRCHLVNCHHYAVLIRDVVLQPGEGSNARGLPGLRSSAEMLDSRGTGGKSDPWVDVERGGAGGGVAGTATNVRLGAAAGSGAAGGKLHGGSGDSPAVAAPTGKVGSPECLTKAAACGTGRRCVGSGVSSSGSDRGSPPGGVSPERSSSTEEAEQDEHNPLLAAGYCGRSSQDSGSTESDSDPGDRADRIGRQRRRRRSRSSRPRRPRPLLQPTSDLPLRDRAIHRVRELRMQHRASGKARAQRAGGASGGPSRPLAASGGDTGRDGSEVQDPLRGAPGGSPPGQRPVAPTGGGTALLASAEASDAEGGADDGPGGACEDTHLWGNVEPAVAAVMRGKLICKTEHQAADWGHPAPGSATGTTPAAAAAAAAAQRRLSDDAAAAGVSGGACLCHVPTPPPCMDGPYDDSEEAAAVTAFYSHLFPESFQRLVPVCNHRAVDELLFQWTDAMGTLAAALLAAHVAVRSVAPRSPTPLSPPSRHRPSKLSPHPHARSHLYSRSQGAAQPAFPHAAAPGTGAAGAAPVGRPLAPPLDLPPPDSAHCAAIRRAAAAVRRLQDRIAVERARALRTPTRRAYVALFSSQRDAAAAAQCSPLAPPSRAQPLHFRACAAPPPDSIYWPALWTLPTGRAARALMSAPLVLVLVVPIGVLTGALANLPVAVCGGTPELNALYWPWFCNRQQEHTMSSRLAKSLLTGLLPALLSLGWNAWVLPMVLYLLSAIQSRCISLPGMDRQMSRWFFWWSLLNMFLGAVVGGGIFQQLGAYLQDPGRLLLRIGTALPTASNFFMHYTLTKGLYSNWLRVAWPHLRAMMVASLRGLAGAALPRSWQDVFLLHSPPGYRFSSFYNGVFQTLMVGLAYVVTAPLIAPIALLFFVTAYVTWRYAVVYIYERQYESGGQMFPVVFDHMCGYLLVAEFFTGAVLLTNGAWIQAALLWCSLTPAIVAFRRFCYKRYLWPLEHPPMSLSMAAPPAAVDAAVYLPPALREGSAGWYPESGKVWEQYNIPKYVI